MTRPCRPPDSVSRRRRPPLRPHASLCPHASLYPHAPLCPHASRPRSDCRPRLISTATFWKPAGVAFAVKERERERKGERERASESEHPSGSQLPCTPGPSASRQPPRTCSAGFGPPAPPFPRPPLPPPASPSGPAGRSESSRPPSLRDPPPPPPPRSPPCAWPWPAVLSTLMKRGTPYPEDGQSRAAMKPLLQGVTLKTGNDCEASALKQSDPSPRG